MEEKLKKFIKKNYQSKEDFVGCLIDEYLIAGHLYLMEEYGIFTNCKFGSQDIENTGRAYAYVTVGLYYDLVFDWDVDFTDLNSFDEVMERLVSYEALATELVNKYK